MPVFLNILFLVIGMVFLIKGADFFVEGSSKIAKALKIPSLIIGLTLVSIGTSLPELSVSLTSSLKGLVDMSVGNVVGSNIFNVFVVIGCSALFTPMIVSKTLKKYDIPILLGVYGLLALFSFVISPLVIKLWEGIIIFALFISYILFLLFRSKKENEIEEIVDDKPRKWYVNVIFVILGLAGIIVGGNFVVETAKNLATIMGMDEMLVSLTIVAVGTSLPELVTSIVAAKKKENDIAVGNAIGSCLFNVLLILGVSSVLSPTEMAVQLYCVVDFAVMFVAALLIFLFAFKKGKVNKAQGIILVAIYVLYLAYIVLRFYLPEIFSF